ncbi:MAG: branched-chain amino acid transport system substrate-binding protein [Solirubrobacterales bacterium]|jgi:branched-chain amino acid transport system substrate-binding protein|nr:branched-chain amino acid transport system substrate-binding protein [Solirubrobacterales bacterium]
MPRRPPFAHVNRRAALGLTLAVGLIISGGGCSAGTGSSKVVGSTLTVYVGLPLHGPAAKRGQAIENGIKLALADAGGQVAGRRVEAVYLDDTAATPGAPPRWSQSVAADDARRASQDVTAIGYIGDLDSGATRVSLPITNQAEMAQVSPASSAVDLTRSANGLEPARLQPSGRPSFARVVPADDVQAGAAALWAKRLGARKVAVLSSGEPFGNEVATAFADEARRLGLDVVAEQSLAGARGSALTARIRKAVGARPDAVYFGGTALRALAPLEELSGLDPGALVFGSDALLDPGLLVSFRGQHMEPYLTSPFLDAAHLPAAGQRFAARYRQRFGSAPLAEAAYGYESMALLLDAIRRAGGSGDDRTKVIDALLATQDRRSILGTYSLDEFGDTSLRAMSGYRVSGGRARFAASLEAPRP